MRIEEVSLPIIGSGVFRERFQKCLVERIRWGEMSRDGLSFWHSFAAKCQWQFLEILKKKKKIESGPGRCAAWPDVLF